MDMIWPMNGRISCSPVRKEVTPVKKILALMVLANRINVLATGDNSAISLGEKPTRIRVVCFVIMSMATAVAVCYTGTIGFVTYSKSP